MRLSIFYDGSKRTRILFFIAAAFLSGTMSGAVLLRFWQKLFLRRTTLRVAAMVRGRTRRPILCVTGSATNEMQHLAEKLGAWCAHCGLHLLTGGGGGVMTSVARAFVHTRETYANIEGGVSIAVLPGLPASRASEWPNAREEDSPRRLVDQSSGYLQYATHDSQDAAEQISAPSGYPNEFVEIAIRTHLPNSGAAGHTILSRNHICVLSADVVVALPGGPGTASAIHLAMQYGISVCLFLGKSGKIETLTQKALETVPSCRCFAELQKFVCGALEKEREPAPAGERMVRGISRRDLSSLDLE